MWFFLLTLALVASLQVNAAIIPTKRDSSSYNDISVMVSNVIKNRCLKYADEDAYTELESTINSVPLCIVRSMQRPNLRNMDDITNMMCTTARPAHYKCIESALEKVNPCLAPEEKYLPEFILRAHNISYDQHCQGGAEDLKAMMIAFNSAKCDPPASELQTEMMEACVPKIEVIEKLRQPAFVLTKNDFCSAIEIGKECAVSKAKSICNNNEGIANYVSGLFDHHLQLCSEEKGTSTNLVD